MLFDPMIITRHEPLAPGSALRRWLKRLCVVAVLGIGAIAALMLFAPLIWR
ncbi:MAG: hypothetical protein RH942_10115 [Kiloniellaceae bacterium]